MGFFGGNRSQAPVRPLNTTPGGVPADAVTRLRRMRGEGGAPLFTSDLSVSEFVLLKQLGMKPLGLVLGSSIYHVGIQYGNLFQNQELDYLTQALYHARELAISRMEEEAAVLGADGVVGVRLEVGSYLWAGDALEFTAVGTAVQAPAGEDHRKPDQKPFTSSFSVQEFYKLYQVGYVPAELVLGNCVYHVAHQNMLQQMGQIGVNVELPNYTQAIYEARELAMGRMQAEAEAHGAEGIIGMNIIEKNHGWQPHVIEFLALGTSIMPRRGYTGSGKLGTDPIVAVGLND